MTDSKILHPDRRRSVRATVTGHVQGVGFRWSCLQEAQSRGIVGQVRNLPDGDVEVLAQGAADDVDHLLAWLRRGPRWAQVSSVQLEELPPGSLRHRDFSVGW